jgi:hypothetical protein
MLSAESADGTGRTVDRTHLPLASAPALEAET